MVSHLFCLLDNLQHEYLIIESPDINTIGVGEGTTGFFMNVIDNIPNISIKEFIKKQKQHLKLVLNLLIGVIKIQIFLIQ